MSFQILARTCIIGNIFGVTSSSDDASVINSNQIINANAASTTLLFLICRHIATENLLYSGNDDGAQEGSMVADKPKQVDATDRERHC
jgi:hypothetical protein